jgi:hypothetical protein
MRISIDPSHPAYHPAAGLCRYFLEGAERSNVKMADEDGRFAVTYRLNEHGERVKDAKGNPLTDNFWGHVRIECAQWIRHEQDHGGPVAAYLPI